MLRINIKVLKQAIEQNLCFGHSVCNMFSYMSETSMNIDEKILFANLANQCRDNAWRWSALPLGTAIQNLEYLSQVYAPYVVQPSTYGKTPSRKGKKSYLYTRSF